MPRLIRSIRAYRKHRASGQAIVTLGYRDFYLGPYGSKISRSEYDRLVGEWLQQGRQLDRQAGDRCSEADDFCVNQLIVAYLRFADDLAELMGHLNNFISADHGGDRFMTMHLSVIDSTAGTMRWVSAGHDSVIVFDPADNGFTEMGEGDLPLGVMEDTQYREQTSAALRPGQILFIGTDGVWEMPDAKGEQYGKDPLRDAIRDHAAKSADEIACSVRERLTAFRGDVKSVDDVTFVVVKVLAAESDRIN